MSKQTQIEKEFLLPDLKKGPESYLQEIRNVVSKHSGSQITLKVWKSEKEKQYRYKVGSLAETLYEDEQTEMLEEWEQFYLPDHMFMAVIGVIEKFPCNSPNDELVLMVCEDGKVFAYEEDRLHLVSDNLGEMFKSGLKFPGKKQYYRGERFKDMTDKEWDEVRKSDKVKKMMKEHQKTLMCMKDSFLTNLAIIKGRKPGESPAATGGKPVKPIPVP